MNKKMILPMIAIVFALASAFTSKPVAQMAWYKNPAAVPQVQQGNISIPSNPDPNTCAVGRTNVCQVGSFDAHSSAAGAASPSSLTLLKYN